jgi:hypothetical protein
MKKVLYIITTMIKMKMKFVSFILSYSFLLEFALAINKWSFQVLIQSSLKFPFMPFEVNIERQRYKL